VKKTFKAFWTRFVGDDSGQDLVEYALLAAVIGSVGAAVFPTIQTWLNSSKGPFFKSQSDVQNLWIPKPPG
jgi:Flp pilus assembly pilin Flp